MTVITTKTSAARANATNQREASEFDGLWINPGVNIGDESNEGEQKFVRLPRGIAVGDLKQRKIYESMDPDFATEAAIMNQVITMIQQKALTLAEGESIPINLELRLYRRQEEADVAPDKDVNESLAKSLFG